MRDEVTASHRERERRAGRADGSLPVRDKCGTVRALLWPRRVCWGDKSLLLGGAACERILDTSAKWASALPRSLCGTGWRPLGGAAGPAAGTTAYAAWPKQQTARWALATGVATWRDVGQDVDQEVVILIRYGIIGCVPRCQPGGSRNHPAGEVATCVALAVDPLGL